MPAAAVLGKLHIYASNSIGSHFKVRSHMINPPASIAEANALASFAVDDADFQSAFAAQWDFIGVEIIFENATPGPIFAPAAGMVGGLHGIGTTQIWRQQDPNQKRFIELPGIRSEAARPVFGNYVIPSGGLAGTAIKTWLTLPGTEVVDKLGNAIVLADAETTDTLVRTFGRKGV